MSCLRLFTVWDPFFSFVSSFAPLARLQIDRIFLVHFFFLCWEELMMNSAGSFRVVSQTSFLLWLCTCNDSSTLSKRIVILNLPGKKAKNTQVIDEEPFFCCKMEPKGKQIYSPKRCIKNAENYAENVMGSRKGRLLFCLNGQSISGRHFSRKVLSTK